MLQILTTYMSAYQVPGSVLVEENMRNIRSCPLWRTANPSAFFTENFAFTLSLPAGVVEELLIPCSMLCLVGWNGSRPRRENNSNYFCLSLLDLFPISCRRVIVGFAELTLSWIAGSLYRFVGPLIPSRANAQARCTEWLFFSNI